VFMQGQYVTRSPSSKAIIECLLPWAVSVTYAVRFVPFQCHLIACEDNISCLLRYCVRTRGLLRLALHMTVLTCCEGLCGCASVYAAGYQQLWSRMLWSVQLVYLYLKEMMVVPGMIRSSSCRGAGHGSALLCSTPCLSNPSACPMILHSTVDSNCPQTLVAFVLSVLVHAAAELMLGHVIDVVLGWCALEHIHAAVLAGT